MPAPSLLSRRSALLMAAISAAAISSPGRALIPASRAPVPLPSPDQIRRDYQAMVDFGPRLPGSTNHLRFVDWLAREFRAAGLSTGPCENYAYKRWEPKRWGLDIFETSETRSVRDVAYFVRSKPTGPAGVEGP